MLDRQTGKVLHIDFGDCFEVAMHREKYPEKGGLNFQNSICSVFVHIVLSSNSAIPTDSNACECNGSGGDRRPLQIYM